MRSSESAHSARIATSFSSRCLPVDTTSVANATTQNTISGTRQRARRARLAAALIAPLSSDSGEQAVWPEDQHGDQNDIDDEAAQRRGEIVLARDVGDPEQQGCNERPHDPRCATDR